MPHVLHDDAHEASHSHRGDAPIAVCSDAYGRGGAKRWTASKSFLSNTSSCGRRDKSGRGSVRSGSSSLWDGKLHYTGVRPPQASRTGAKQNYLLVNAFEGFSCPCLCVMYVRGCIY